MKKKDAIDIGTTELSKHFQIVPRLTRGHYGFNGKVMDETEIDRLLLEERIDPTDHSILENFLGRLHRVGFVGLKSPSYDSPVHADASMVGDKRAHAIRAVTRLHEKLDEAIGMAKRKALVNLVLLDTPWPLSDDDLRSSIKHLSDAMR